ncbi:MAG: A/G-specific adenine glycosylase [Methylotenera sp.]|nr:A/G-specific adenine glycosylase [Methylotenera sp.]
MNNFSTRLIAWQKIHGRHDLPWQDTTDPYAIWVSEIMLQQTQVAAVIGYYSKFMQRFPDIATLAHATQEEVLQYWSGLGYYSRARNLHHAAQTIVDMYNGEFPHDFDTIQTLSGIGRSTAAAIASFAFNQVQTILDGNVKRVLARHFLVEGWPSNPRVEKQLWIIAEELLPEQDMVDYTQGLMDLGATVCTRSKPKCGVCPVQQTCKAYQMDRVKDLPTPRPRKTIPEKNTMMLILQRGDEIMLEKRPSSGIWGGLWSFPEVEKQEEIEGLLTQKYQFSTHGGQALPTLSHTFTHFKLHIQPQLLQIIKIHSQVGEAGQIWLSVDDAIGAAVPTPVRKLLMSLKREPTV